MTPFRWVTGGGDQENSTSLSPATAENISGDPVGTERMQTQWSYTPATRQRKKINFSDTIHWE